MSSVVAMPPNQRLMTAQVVQIEAATSAGVPAVRVEQFGDGYTLHGKQWSVVNLQLCAGLLTTEVVGADHRLRSDICQQIHNSTVIAITESCK